MYEKVNHLFMLCSKAGKKSSQNFSRISYEGTRGTELPIHCEALKRTLACNIWQKGSILSRKEGFLPSFLPSFLVSLHMQLFFISFNFVLNDVCWAQHSCQYFSPLWLPL